MIQIKLASLVYVSLLCMDQYVVWHYVNERACILTDGSRNL